MQLACTIVGLALIGMISSACRSPRQPPAPPASAPVVSASAATSAEAAPAATEAPAPIDPAIIKAGYKATLYRGQVFYCRKQQVTGTQFKRKVCLNEAQLREEQRKTKELQESMMRQRAGAACTPMPACAG